MIDRLLKGIQTLIKLARGAAAILLCLSVALNFANIIGRYFFSVSISWAEEIMLFLMCGCVFLGVGPVSWANRHIRMDIVVNMLPAPAKKFMELLAELAFLATAALVIIFSVPVIADLAAFDERSQAANFPLVIPQAMIPIGFGFMGLLVAIRVLTDMAAARRARLGAEHEVARRNEAAAP
ncbi:MAG TPA: TRAP transporter small permease [Stellaceae bacterium]|nr:TRAP transporter small permease [Stellaceae bacterium]